MPEYKSFLISDMKTGLAIGKKPWLIPNDAWATMFNARLDKGVIKRRQGVVRFIDEGMTPMIGGIGSVAVQAHHQVIAAGSDASKDYVYQIYENGRGIEIYNATPTKGASSLGASFWMQQYARKIYMTNGYSQIKVFTPHATGGDDVYGSVAEMDTGAVTIQTCQMLFQYKNRLLFVSPEVGGKKYHDYLYYTDVNSDNVGATNVVLMQQGDIPVTGSYINGEPVIFCQNGKIYHITYTQNTDAPFTWGEPRTTGYPVKSRFGCDSFQNKIFVAGINRLYTYDGDQVTPIDEVVRGITNEIFDRIYRGTSERRGLNSALSEVWVAALTDRESIYIGHDYQTGQVSNLLEYNYAEESFSEHQVGLVASSPRIFPFRWYWTNCDSGVCTTVLGDDIANLINGGGVDEQDAVGTLMVSRWTTQKSILFMNYGFQDNWNGTPAGITPDCLSKEFNPFLKDGKKVRVGDVKILVTTDNTHKRNLRVRLYKDGVIAPDSVDAAFVDKTIDCSGTRLGATPGYETRREWVVVHGDGEVGQNIQLRIGQTYDEGDLQEEGIEVHAVLFEFAPSNRLDL